MEPTEKSDLSQWKRLCADLQNDPDHQHDLALAAALAPGPTRLTPGDQSRLVRWCLAYDKAAWLDEFAKRFGLPTTFNFCVPIGRLILPDIQYHENAACQVLKHHLASLADTPIHLQLGSIEDPMNQIPRGKAQRNLHVVADCFSGCRRLESLVLGPMLPPDTQGKTRYHQRIVDLACHGGQLKALALTDLPDHYADPQETMCFVTDVLYTNRQLESLSLGSFSSSTSSRIHWLIFNPFVNQLAKLKCLSRLTIDGPFWRNGELFQLLDELCRLPSLHTLELANAAIDEEAAVALEKAVGCAVLNDLRVRNCEMTEATHARLMGVRVPNLACTGTVFV